MNYTQEQLAALQDIELNLIIARDVAGLKNACVFLNKVYTHPKVLYMSCSDVDENPELYIVPDYLNDLNAIDDLCKEKGLTWTKEIFDCSVTNMRGSFAIVDYREGEFPRGRFLCEALKYADQESKK